MLDMRYTKRVNVPVTEDMNNRLDTLTQKQRRTRAEVVRKALEAYLKKELNR